MYMYLTVIDTYLYIVGNELWVFFFSQRTLKPLFSWKTSCVTCSHLCHRTGPWKGSLFDVCESVEVQ